MLTRILLSPFRIRLASFSVLIAAVFATWLILMSCAGAVIPWWVIAIAIPTAAVVLGTLLASATHTVARQYCAALHDLATPTERNEAIRASVRGTIPSEGDVLTAARRLAWLSLRMYGRVGLWTMSCCWFCVAAIIGLGIIPAVIMSEASIGVITVLILFAVAYGCFAVWIQADQRRASRRATQLELEYAFRPVTHETS